MRQAEPVTGVVREMLSDAGFLKRLANRVIDALTRCAGTQFPFAASHGLHAELIKSHLIGRWFLADNKRVREIAAVKSDHHGEIENEHLAWFDDALGRWTAAAGGTGANREVAVDDHRQSCRAHTSSADSAVDLQFSHARLDVGAGPGMASVRRGHAAPQECNLVRMLLAAHLRQCVNNDSGIGVAGPVMYAHAAAARVDGLQDGQLPRTMARRLTVIPRDLAPLFDMSCFDGMRQAVVMQQFGIAVFADHEIAREACA